jgi:hypothetical protein
MVSNLFVFYVPHIKQVYFYEALGFVVIWFHIYISGFIYENSRYIYFLGAGIAQLL